MRPKLPVVVIVGRPNVGKSTLFNRIVGKRVAVVEDSPGITRDRLYAETQSSGRHFVVVDTGGILFMDDDPLVEQIRVQAQIALAEADVVLFLVDAAEGINPADIDLANHLRGFKKPILVVANKADNPKREATAGEFYELGIGDVYSVSGLHGRGVHALIDHVVGLLPPVEVLADEREEIRLAIVGRPNVGKSSLFNAFTGEQRAIVSNIPGTTRDAIDTLIEYRDERFRLIDTAGLRRRGKTQGTVEYYMALRATNAIERAQCALIVIDGNDGLTDGDKRIAKIAHDEGRALVVAVNKWDLIEPPDGYPRRPRLSPSAVAGKEGVRQAAAKRTSRDRVRRHLLYQRDRKRGPRAGSRQGDFQRGVVELPNPDRATEPTDPRRDVLETLHVEGQDLQGVLRDPGRCSVTRPRSVLGLRASCFSATIRTSCTSRTSATLKTRFARCIRSRGRRSV